MGVKQVPGAIGILILAAAALSQTPSPPPSLGAEDPRARGAAFAQNQPAEFAWLMFLNLVSPAKPGVRGIRDPTKSVGAPVATVWETFKNAADIYLPDGRRPEPWSFLPEMRWPQNSKLAPSKTAFLSLGPVDSTWTHFLAEDRMIDGFNIVSVASRIVRYEVRDNKATFDYVVNNPSGYQLYNLDGQESALSDAKFTFAFPSAAIEVKASWQILGPADDPSRYWTANVVFFDQENRPEISRAGLTGLHFTSKLLPNWFWATFEQVDNPTATFTEELMQKGPPVGPNQDYNNAATPENQKFDAALQGTKWQYYRLMGWQTQFVENNQPALLGNTQMETYFQKNSSCITCHSLANIGPPSMVRLSMWNTAGGNLTGFTGNVNFQQLAQQQAPGLSFKQMDYVWSLREARPRQIVPFDPGPVQKKRSRP